MNPAHPIALPPLDRLLSLIDGFAAARVAVLGDYMLDRYHYGEADRISPEAPVPVLRIVRKESTLGGAASVAAGVAALGARALCVGIIGDDDAGRELSALLRQTSAATGGLISTADRPTTLKTRLIGLAQHRHRQQIVRMDEENSDPVGGALESRLLAAVGDALRECDVLCIQDYGKGVATDSICRKAIALAHQAGKRVLIDPMRSGDTARYAGAFVCTPNRTETEAMIGRRLPNEPAVRAAAKEILAAAGTEHVCVTLDAEGCALIGPGGAYRHVPTKQRDVYDVTGAGDEVLAALAVAVAGGAELHEAAHLANVAGGLEVEKFGCVPIARHELIDELLLERGRFGGKLIRTEALLPLLERRRARGQKLVFTNGCFDILHRGHVEYFEFCRKQGDVVIVGLNTDASVRRQNKGPDRPINSQEDRAAVLAGLASVDYIVLFDEETPLKLIESIRPDFLVKGADWQNKPVAGREVVESGGGQVLFAPLVPNRSTTGMIDQIRRL